MWIHQRAERAARTGASADRGDEALQAWLAEWVTRLALPRNFWAEPHANRRTGAVLSEALSGWGYEVHVQGDYRNVVALPPSRTSKPLVLVGAHYDSVPHCPGADDNASGVAVLLASAKAIATSPGTKPLPVAFVAFNAEEDGLLGSRDFVQNGMRELGIHPALVHVLEMVGFRSRASGSQRLPLPWPGESLRTGDFLALVSNREANDASDALLSSDAVPRPRCVALQQWLRMDGLVPELRRSDHFPFWEENVPSLLWTDTADLRNPNYHRVTDAPHTLDYALMAEITNLLVSSLSTAGEP